jgi:DNA primase
MGQRIPQSFIDDVLSRADIVDVIDKRVPLKKAGREYKACCPFHGEKTPSFTVSQQKQFYHCFGCGANGSAIGFLMEFDNLSFPEAIKELAESLGMPLPESEFSNNTPSENNTPQLVELAEQANQYFRHQLKNAPQAIDYLKRRGLSGETVAAFEIGYAPDGWHNLEQTLGKNNLTLKNQLETVGMLIRRDNGEMYDRFRDRIMFPIRDRRGRTIAFGGRIIDQGEPKYLNSPETPIFHKGQELYGLYQARQANRNLTQLMVVEGYMDVVALAEHGIQYAVATLGTAITEPHLKLLKRHCEDVIFCFDGDRAGRQAAWRAAETALPMLSQGLQLRFLFLPDGEDPDTMVGSIGKEAFEALLQKAQPFSQFFFENLIQEADMRGLDGQAKLLQKARPLLAKVDDSAIRQLLIVRLAEQINMPPQQLYALLNNQAGDGNQAPPQGSSNQGNQWEGKKKWVPNSEWKKGKGRKFGRDDRPAPITGRRDNISPVRMAITLLLHQPTLAQQVSLSPQLQQLELPGMRLLADLVEFLQQRPNITTGAVLENWRDTPEGNSLRKLATQEILLDDESISQEFLDTINTLEKKSVEQRLEELLKKSAHMGLDEQEKALLNELLLSR